MPGDYEHYWKDWRESAGPVDPFGPHHVLAPDPEFAMLCADAAALGLVVELSVGRHRLGDRSAEYRLLHRIRVADPHATIPAALVPIADNEPLGAAAARARSALEAR